VTLSPCFDCAKLIIQAGIKRIVYSEVYRKTDSFKLFEEAGIEIKQMDI
jgi:dCMP deaminase